MNRKTRRRTATSKKKRSFLKSLPSDANLLISKNMVALLNFSDEDELLSYESELGTVYFSRIVELSHEDDQKVQERYGVPEGCCCLDFYLESKDEGAMGTLFTKIGYSKAVLDGSDLAPGSPLAEGLRTNESFLEELIEIAKVLVSVGRVVRQPKADT